MKSLLLKIRFRLAPAGSRRERAYHTLRVGLAVWRRSGFRRFLQTAPWWLRSGWSGSGLSGEPPARDDAYQRWRRRVEPGRRDLARQSREAGVLPYRPLISVITPVFNPPSEILDETLGSVQSQTYDRWEYRLVDGGSDRAGVREVLQSWAERDDRLKVQFLGENRGISGNLNAALALAQGEYVAFLDHDDLLAPEALFQIVKALNEEPRPDVVYFDEDKISEDGRSRRAPWFKPTRPSPSLMLSTNVLMHSVVRRSLLEEVGGFDPAMDGAQDWDLALRLIEDDPRVVHVPRVLYHWRQVPGSASRDINAKPWAFPAQKRCLEAHLARRGVDGARVEFPEVGRVRITWPAPRELVSLLIPTRDKVSLLRRCLDSILEKTTYPNYEILVLDNGSQEEETLAYFSALEAEARVRVIPHPGPFNFHTINNRGARETAGQVLVFLNNDTEVLEPTWLEELAGWALQPGVGPVGAKLLRPDGTIQHAGIIMGLAGHGSHVFDGAPEETYGPFGSSEWYRDYQAVTGACLAVSREVFEALDGFDETYRVGYGDIDLCLRATAAGRRVVYTPFARLLHHEGGTRGLHLPPADVLRASLTMFDRVQADDPFFNPNLSHRQRVPVVAAQTEGDRSEILLKILYDFDLLGQEDPGIPDPARWRPPLPARSRSRRRKILVVSHELSRTGAPIILWNVAERLAAAGYGVRVLSPFDGPLKEAYEGAGMPAEVLPFALEDARRLVGRLGEADLVLANTILTFRAVNAARAFGVPALWWVHESSYGRGLAESSPGVAGAFRAAQAVLFPAQAIADLYTDFGDPASFHPIHYGVELPGGEEAGGEAPPFQRQPGKLYLAHIGSVEHRKGQDLTLGALESLPPAIRGQVECFFIGRILEKSERAYCRRILRAGRRLPNVHVLGEVPLEQVRAYLEAADVFVLPSRDEALPISMLEAVGVGKPVLVSRVGGVEEVIEHGVNGLLVDREDVGGIAEQILTLYNNRELLPQLAAAARRTYLAGLTLERFSGQVLDLVRDLIGEP